MVEPESGWHWFEPTADSPDHSATSEIEKNFARCFSGPDGASVLAHLRAMTIERTLGPDTGDSALRHLEGQRHLVAQISAIIARGRDKLA